jgi:hypothetical protein
MISRSNTAGRTIRKLQQFFEGRRFSIDPPLAQRVAPACRGFHVVQAEGHVFVEFTPEERTKWQLPEHAGFCAGAEYRDATGRNRYRGRLKTKEDPRVETRRVNVGDIDTPEMARLVHFAIDEIIAKSDYAPDNIDALSCIGAADLLAATRRGKFPLAPVGTNTLDRADDYMTKLSGTDGSAPAGELTFHIRRPD